MTDPAWQPVREDVDSCLTSLRSRERAQIWKYVVSHAQMLVRYYDSAETSGVYLWFKGVEKASFDPYWTGCDPQIVLSAGKSSEPVLVTDGNHLRIEAAHAFWTETSMAQASAWPYDMTSS